MSLVHMEFYHLEWNPKIVRIDKDWKAVFFFSKTDMIPR